MNLHAPKVLRRGAYPAWGVYANVFMGRDDSRVEYRVDGGDWKPMQRVQQPDPRLLAENLRDDAAEALRGYDRSPEADAVGAPVARRAADRPRRGRTSRRSARVRCVAGRTARRDPLSPRRCRGVMPWPLPCPVDLPIKRFATQAAWEKWLAAHAGEKGVWLKIAKKDQGVTSVTYAEALDVALCHGWIDGQKRGCDEQYFLQRFTPRRPKSLWSKINIGKAEQLIASWPHGRGRPARSRGRQGRRSLAGGVRRRPATWKCRRSWRRRWRGIPKARRFFEQLDRTNRYAFCWRVQTAKKPETRQARVAKFIAMLERGEKIHG